MGKGIDRKYFAKLVKIIDMAELEPILKRKPVTGNRGRGMLYAAIAFK